MASHYDGVSLEEAAERLISCSDELRRKTRIYCNLYRLWAQKRKETIASVKEIASSIDEDHKNANISNLVGGSVAVVGGGVAIAGLCLIPFTFGVSALFLTGAGAVAAVGGGATGAGASLTDYFLRKKNFEKAMNAIQSDRDQTQQLAKTAEEINKLENELQNVALFLLQKINTDQRIRPRTESTSNLQQWIEGGLIAAFGGISKYLPDAVRFGKLSVTVAERISESIAWLKNIPEFVVKLKVLIQGASAGRAILASAGGILAGIGIALELANIAVTAVDVHHGSKTKEAKDLYDIAEELENELSRATDLFNEVD